jgi:hypothetical protein
MGKKIKIYNPTTGETKVIDESEIDAYGAQPMPQEARDYADANNLFGDAAEPSQKKGIVQSLLEPFVNTAKNIGAAPIEATRALALNKDTKALDENTQQQMMIMKRLKGEKDPVVKKILLEESRKLSEVGQGQRKEVQRVSDVKNPFLSMEKMEQISKDRKGYVVDQIKDSAEIASYGVPLGKAGFFGSKFLAPGAAVGGIQAATTDEAGLNWQTADDVAMGALTGAGIGLGAKAVTGVVGKVLNKTGKISPTLDKAADAIEQGQRQIKLPASVYGAGEEKAVNQTLTKYKIKGSPDEQYAMLEPTMKNIEGQIEKVIANNPNIKVPKAEIVASFKEKLKGSVRTGDLTNKQAKTEVESYLNDLIKSSGGTGKFTDLDLTRVRALKKLLNEDYKSVQKAITNNTSLSPRQKIIDAAWGSLDDAVNKYSEDMATLLTDESNLYKSARSLSAGRFNAPTERFMGTSIPAPIENAGKSKLVDILRGGANKTKTVSKVAEVGDKVSSNSRLIQLLTQGAIRSPQILGNNNQVPNDEQNQNNNQDLQPTPTLPQETKTATGYTLEQLGQGYAAAIQAGDTASAKQLKEMYDLEEGFQKTQGEGDQKLTQRQAMFQSAAESATRALEMLETGNVSIGPVSGPLQGLLGKVDKTSSTQNQYQATVALARSALLNAFLGGNIPPSEFKRISEAIPTSNDGSKRAKDKLLTFIREMQSYASGNVQESMGGYQTGNTSDY